MTDERLHALAAKIAADLFTGIDGEHAERLQLQRDDRWVIVHLGHWTESAVRERIYAALKEGMEGE